MWNQDKVKEVIQSDKVVIFGKGSRFEPMCGFTAKAIRIMDQYLADYTVVNIFDDENIRPSLVAVSGWPTTPQLFINGELIGGSDIMEELAKTGALKNKLTAAKAL